MNPEETEEWSNKLYYKNQYDPESCKEIMKIAMDVLNNQKLLNPAEPTSSTMFIKDVSLRILLLKSYDFRSFIFLSTGN